MWPVRRADGISVWFCLGLSQVAKFREVSLNSLNEG